MAQPIRSTIVSSPSLTPLNASGGPPPVLTRRIFVMVGEARVGIPIPASSSGQAASSAGGASLIRDVVVEAMRRMDVNIPLKYVKVVLPLLKDALVELTDPIVDTDTELQLQQTASDLPIEHFHEETFDNTATAKKGSTKATASATTIDDQKNATPKAALVFVRRIVVVVGEARMAIPVPASSGLLSSSSSSSGGIMLVRDAVVEALRRIEMTDEVPLHQVKVLLPLQKGALVEMDDPIVDTDTEFQLAQVLEPNNDDDNDSAHNGTKKGAAVAA
jgi:hypothetical protein